MKSLAMNKLFSKSREDLPKINSDLDMILTEQRHQRADLQEVKRMLVKINNSIALQTQVDEFYEKEESKRDTED